MNNRAMRVWLGSFVLAALLLLAVLVTLFGGFPDLFKTMSRYTVTFDYAPGVGPGTPVRRSGIRIGEVKSVQLDNDTGKVRVHILVDAQYTLRRKDQAVLVHGLLGGDTSIDFVPREGQEQPGDGKVVEAGSTVLGVNQANVGAVVNQASALMPPAQDTLVDLGRVAQGLNRITSLMEATLREYRDLARTTRQMMPEWQGVARASREMIPELKEMLKESRKAVPSLNRTSEEVQVAAATWGSLGEHLSVFLQTNDAKLDKALDNLNKTLNNIATSFGDENRKNLTAALRNVKAGSDHLESLTKNTDDLVKESRVTLLRVNNSIGRADDVLASLQEAVKPLPQRGRGIMKNLEESAETLNKLLADMRELTRAVNINDGSLRRFLVDPTLYNNLNDAACLLTRVVPRLDRILRDTEVFADKIARHPEALGLGGVVRPSAGLKDNPFTPVHGGPPDH
jgi:phospholipid/cholesterol/gamma-HCH transport system substrate-binding protein